MTYLDSALGKSIVLKDKLPEGMELDTSFPIEYDEAVLNEWGGMQQILSQENRTYYTTDTSVLATAPGFWQDYNENDPGGNEKSIPVKDLRITGTHTYDAAVNEVTFEIPINGNFDIIKEYYKEFWPGFKTQMMITYRAKVTDQEAFDKAGVKKTFTNKVTGEYNGIDLGAPGVNTQELSPHKLNKKSVGTVDSNILVSIDGINYNAVSYVVDVNTYAYDLSVGKLVAVDKLSKELSHYLDSIKAYDLTSGVKTELAQGLGTNQYSFTYNASDNSVEFVLPDSKHLQIEYLALVNLYSGTKTGDETLTSFTAINEFKLKGYTEENSKAQSTYSATVKKNSFWAISENCTIKIRKFWSGDGVLKTVLGSEFAVYKVTYSGGTYSRGEGHQVGSENSWML